MKKEEEIKFKKLINSLILFASSYDYLMSIDSPTFDIEFELGSEFELGLDLRNIDDLYAIGKLNSELRAEIIEFRNYVLIVPDAFWTVDELESNPIWKVVRKKADSILKHLNIENREYDFSIIKIL